MMCSFCGAKSENTILCAAPMREDVMVCRACASQIVGLIDKEARRRVIAAAEVAGEAENAT